MDNYFIEVVDYEEYKKELIEIREEVFVIEQSVPEDLEIDGLDPDCIHVLIHCENLTLGTGRMQKDGHIGRVAVRKAYRGRGYGKEIINKLISRAKELNISSVYLGAQLTAEGFYSHLGFSSYGDIFLDAGIRHIMMKKLI